MSWVWLFLVLVLLAVAVTALILANRTSTRIQEIGRRLESLELEIVSLRRAARRSGVEPWEDRAPAGEPTPAEAAAAEPRPEVVEAETPSPPGPPEAPAPASEAGAEVAAPSPGERLPSPWEHAPWYSTRELEQRLGARLPVWIGAVALILAAAFLVKLSFDRGWLGPPVRVALGVLFGIALLVGGEVLRRGSARVAQGLSAAGVAVLFVAFYAGVGLYGLIPAAAGFALMVLTTAVAVGLSLRQGPMVAVLGLVGGFLTPYLVRPGEPDARLFFLYLLLLQAGLVAVSRRRGWWPLSGLAFAAGLVWLGVWLTEAPDAARVLWMGLFVLASVALFVGSGAAWFSGASEAYRARAGGLSWLAGAGGLAALAALVLRADYDPRGWILLAILGAGCLALARLEPEFHLLAWVGAGVPALLIGNWIEELGPAQGDRFLWTALALGGLHAAGAYAALWGSRRPERWGFLAAAAGLAFTLLAYAGASKIGRPLPWGGICLTLAALSIAGAVPLARLRGREPGLEGALAGLAVAATAFVSLAVPMELERQWLSVAWALEVTALVWLAGRLRVPVLTRLAWILAAAVAARLLLNPFVLTYPIGEHPLVNWLSYGYGLPVVAFAVASWLARGQRQAELSEALHWGALVLGVALATLLVRQYFHPGEPAAASFDLAEWGTLTTVWLGLAWLSLRADARWSARPWAGLGGGLPVLALAQGLLAQGLAANPIWFHEAVGTLPIVNRLLWVYGAPAALLALHGREQRGRAPAWLAPLFGTGSLIMIFLLVTLEVRQAFRGPYLDEGAAGGAEQYAYSAAWILLGIALLIAGIAGRGRLLRLASLAIMLLAVGKVFLFDMAELGGFYRVFSFLGLGLSLLLIAWLYQRFVFRE